MKKNILILLFFWVFSPAIYSSPVDSTQAEKLALSFLDTKGLIPETSAYGGWQKNISLRLADSDLMSPVPPGKKSISAAPSYYIFNIEDNQGFIIISGDSRVYPVLGYSRGGNFQQNNIPPAFREWLEFYEKEIEYIVENIPEGQQDDDYFGLTEDGEVESRAPLLSTTWNQGCYYNDNSPVDDRGPCDKAWAGCVANAIVQIMKYWNHPAACSAIPGYNDGDNYSDGEKVEGSNYGYIDGINPTNYDWANMPNSLNNNSTATQRKAVNDLIHHAAVAVRMNFGPYGSGAYSSLARTALVNYFDYSSDASYVRAKYYTDQEWEDLIKNELDLNRPIYYRGSGSGGHAFVCDGYDGDYFHFNWGWGGSYNGYFLLSNLNPAGRNYSDYQEALINLYPNKGPGSPTIEYYKHSINDDSTLGSGNDNGRAEPGEKIRLEVHLKNTGWEPATNVNTTLSCSDEMVSIQDNYWLFEQIYPGLCEEASSFIFEVSEACPEKDVSFGLNITSDQGSWTENFNVHIYPAQIDKHKISGKIIGRYGVGLSGIEIRGFPEPVSSGDEGYYECIVEDEWSGTVTPYRENYWFDPPSTTYENVVSDITTDYNAGVIEYSITGYIRDEHGNPIEDVLLNGLPFNPYTNSDGRYIASVYTGYSGTATPEKTGYTFSPVSTDYTDVTSNQTTDYTAYETKYLYATTGEDSPYFAAYPGESNTITLAVFSNTSWSIEKDAGWFNLSSNYGSGSEGLVVQVLSNNTFPTERQGTITIRGNGVEPCQVEIYQYGSDIYINSQTEYITLEEQAGATKFFEFSSNANWTVGSDLEWLNISPLAGSGSGTLTLSSVSSNHGNSRRGGSIQVTTDEADPLTIYVIQGGKKSVPAPETDTIVVCGSEVVPVLSVSGTNIKWYANADPLRVSDASGNTYPTLASGNQLWMAENLRTTRYNDGSSIPNITSDAEWGELSTGAYVWYNNNREVEKVFGALYNWHAANTGKLCPEGWHVPSDAEWNVLINAWGGKDFAAGDLKSKGTDVWISPNHGATNSSGFAAVPGGFRDVYGVYQNGSEIGWHWATDENSVYARVKRMNYYNTAVNDLDWHKINGFSVRCMKEGSGLIAQSSTYDPGVSEPGEYKYYVTQSIDGIESPKAEMVLIISPAPVVSLGSPEPVCYGESLLLDAGEGFSSYNWSTGAKTQSISVTESGTYRVTVENPYGCTAEDEIELEFYPVPSTVISGKDAACEGDSIVLSAGSGFTSYLWNTGGEDQEISVWESGEYKLSVVDENNCKGSTSREVIFHSLPVVSLGPDTTILRNTSLEITTGGGYSSYLWNTGSEDESILVEGLTEGTHKYFVDVSNEYGCMASDTINVSIDLAEGMVTEGIFSGLKIYPNPAQDYLILKAVHTLPGDTRISILSATGKTLLNRKVSQFDMLNIDLSKFRSGVYLIRVTNGEETGGFVFVKN